MPIPLTWPEIALRLFCAVAAGAFIGSNRSGRGRAAGLRTSILVSMAACIAMLQVNLLLPLAGRHPDSFVMNDLMRLPLGILSGMGFIGAGSIVRRENFVVGVTTAATLWFLTVTGLCFGGGQVPLGLAGTAVAWIVLTGFKYVEDRIQEDRQGKLVIVTDPAGPGEEEIRAILLNGGFRISSCALAITQRTERRKWDCSLRWRARSYESGIPVAIHALAARQGVVRTAWTPQVH
jgi:putative Mg2+ transporter-C (MgtC) family protein